MIELGLPLGLRKAVERLVREYKAEQVMENKSVVSNVRKFFNHILD